MSSTEKCQRCGYTVVSMGRCLPPNYCPKGCGEMRRLGEAVGVPRLSAYQNWLTYHEASAA